MKLKAQKNISEEIPEGSIVEVEDEAAAADMIATGDYVEYTDAVEAEEKAAEAEQVEADNEDIRILAKSIIKSKSVATKNQPTAGAKNMKGLLGKAINQMRIERKAVGDVAGTTATEFVGYVANGNKVWDSLLKMTVAGNLRIVYANTPPTISTVGEGSANAQSALPISKTANPIKKFASFSLPREYFDDVDGMDAYLSGGVSAFVTKAVIAEMIAGSQTGTSYAGLEGIAASADCKSVDFEDIDAPTMPELLAWKNKIHPDLRDGTAFIVNPTFWAGCESVLLNEKNLGNQLIKIGKEPEMFGYPVIVTESAATPICGNLQHYIVGVARDLEVTQQENVATDSVITGVGIRVAGGIAWKADSVYGAFVKAVEASGN